MEPIFSSEQSVTTTMLKPSQTHSNANLTDSLGDANFQNSSPNPTLSVASDPISPLEQSGSRINIQVENYCSDRPSKVDTEDGQLPKQVQEGGEEDEGDVEDPGECGFCLFMKAGGCRDSFIAWENCVEEAEKNKEDAVDKCVDITGALKKCMDAHADYYEPILRAEKVAEQEAIIELENDTAASRSSEQNPHSKDVVTGAQC